MLEKARALGAGRQGVALSDGACAYLVGVIVADLGLADAFPEIDRDLPPFFGEAPARSLELPGVPYLPLLERLFDLNRDADSYFECLAKLHKSRLKYERILAVQPFPSVEQVGPRVLLEFGKTKPSTLGAFLFWRKWVFDLDNRAAQETGYLFETIIAGAIGGAPANAGTSPRSQAKPIGQGKAGRLRHGESSVRAKAACVRGGLLSGALDRGVVVPS